MESSSRRALVVDGVEQHTGGLADLAGDDDELGVHHSEKKAMTLAHRAPR